MTFNAERWSALAAAGAALLLAFLDASVNIAFPAIGAAFGVGVSSIQWVVIAYLLTSASLVPTCGRVADLWGRRRMLVAGVATSLAALTLCGLAGSWGFFLSFRVLQGFGAALIFASAPAVVSASFGPAELGRALGILNMAGYVGFTAGPAVGGLLVQLFGWRSVYLFRLPLALLAAGLGLMLGADSVGRRSPGRRLGLTPPVLLAASVTALLLALSLSSPQRQARLPALLLAVAAAAGLLLFVIADRRAAYPLFDPRLWTPTLALANAANLVANAALFVIWLLVPYYLVDFLHYGTGAGGLLLAPCPFGMALGAPLSGLLTDRMGSRWPQLLGLACEAGGLALAGRLGSAASYPAVAAVLLLSGVGMGVFTVANMSFVMSSVRSDAQGAAAGTVSMMRTLGIVVGANTAALVFGARLAFHEATLARLAKPPAALKTISFFAAFRETSDLGALLCLLALLLAAVATARRVVPPASEVPARC
jgi:MFS family permease